ncbi:uncharacterized protein [Pocillopora verrucosa]|uniref:uncharacterized protein isoform X2 n=1 Tax=Pocillopora verrucosa TaxID=203993 RepID=UPI00333F139D
MNSEKMAGSRESYYAIPLRSTRRDNLPSQFKKPTPGQQSPCEPTQHWVEDEDGSHQCINCGTCPPGQGLSIECGSSKLLPFKTMVVCVPCIAGVSFPDIKILPNAFLVHPAPKVRLWNKAACQSGILRECLCKSGPVDFA